MHTTTSVFDTPGAVLLTAWCVVMWAAVAVLTRTRHRRPPWAYRLALAVTAVGLVGQIGHVQEHVAQVIYWLWHPHEPGWMTPLGDSLARGYGQLTGTDPAVGMEVLHLVGNFIFLAGLVGAVLATRHMASSSAHRWARMGVIMQGIHGLEHVALTVTAAAGLPPVGLSTWFGLLDAGPGLWTYRVWWHFLANVIGTIVFTVVVAKFWRERHRVGAAWAELTSSPRL